MIKLVILLAAAAGVLGASVSEDTPPQAEGRIINGGAATIGSFSYLVAVLENGLHRCGGAIIKDSAVVTTASCVAFIPILHVQIRAGSSYWNSDGVVSDISSIRIHEGFVQKTMQNDVAVLLLRTNLPLGYNIQPIALARANPADGTLAMVSGWGKTTTASAASFPIQVHFTYVDIIGRFQCSSSKYGYGFISVDAICAGANGTGPCDGDGGDPLVVNNVLVGLALGSYGCGNNRYPAVYANVPYHANWIENSAA